MTPGVRRPGLRVRAYPAAASRGVRERTSPPPGASGRTRQHEARGDPTEPYDLAMVLEPVEATLIAASVTSVVSTAAVVATHRLTRGRERRHKVWDRRMDTYVELLKSRRAMGAARRDFLAKRTTPSQVFDAEQELKDLGSLRAQLSMFGSTAVHALDDLALTGFTVWMKAVSEWRDFDSMARADPESARKAEEKLEQIKTLSENADLIEKRLTEAILAEADFKVPFKLERWRSPFRRDFVKR